MDGKRGDFEAWAQRFDWFVQTKSSAFSACLKGHERLHPGLDLTQVGLHAAEVAHDVNVGGAIIKMAIELHGYLQSALQESGLDRALLPQCRGNGFEGRSYNLVEL